MKIETQHKEKNRRISILNDATDSTLTLPTPPNRLLEGRWV